MSSDKKDIRGRIKALGLKNLLKGASNGQKQPAEVQPEVQWRRKLAQGAGQSRATASEDEDDDQGPLKRLSTMWSNFQEKRNRKTCGDDQEANASKRTSMPPAVSICESSSTSERFFEYLVVVSIKKSEDGSYAPHIKYQFPKRDGMGKIQKEEEEKILKAITLFCFPEGVTWAPLTEYHSETFSFVLTEINGSRRNGYCRRLLPHGSGARPPEAYCIISRLACFGLFSKIFDEVEKRRQISMAMIYPFMQGLRESPFPAPGQTVTIKSFIPECGTEVISLTRPQDSWLEHVDFRALFHCLTDEQVLQVFAATVLERHVIFVAEELSTLSDVINAVAALLYPFDWQHTYISIVPEILIEVVMAPTPYLLGIQKHMLDQVMDHVMDQTDLLLVDLTEGSNTFIISSGDEQDILPAKLQEEVLTALSSRKENMTPEELNHLVSEAFLPFFIKTIGHFASFIQRHRKGKPGVFDKKGFCRAVEPKSARMFVQEFAKTQMFDLLVQKEERQEGTHEGFFHKKVAEYQDKKRKAKMW